MRRRQYVTMTAIVFSIIFSLFYLGLFGATFILSLKFLAYVYRDLWPVGKNGPPISWSRKGTKSPVLIRLKWPSIYVN